MDSDKEHPLEGAQFLNPHSDVDDEYWPRNPSEYEVTRKFRQRFKELAGIVDGDDINDAFQYGELVKASQGCMAFVLYKEGYTISIIVENPTRMVYRAISVWPFIYDINETRESGQLSSKQIWRIEEYVGEHKSNWEEN